MTFKDITQTFLELNLKEGSKIRITINGEEKTGELSSGKVWKADENADYDRIGVILDNGNLLDNTVTPIDISEIEEISIYKS